MTRKRGLEASVARRTSPRSLMLPLPRAFFWNNAIARFALASLTWRLVAWCQVATDFALTTRQTRFVCTRGSLSAVCRHVGSDGRVAEDVPKAAGYRWRDDVESSENSGTQGVHGGPSASAEGDRHRSMMYVYH